MSVTLRRSDRCLFVASLSPSLLPFPPPQRCPPSNPSFSLCSSAPRDQTKARRHVAAILGSLSPRLFAPSRLTSGSSLALLRHCAKKCRSSSRFSRPFFVLSRVSSSHKSLKEYSAASGIVALGQTEPFAAAPGSTGATPWPGATSRCAQESSPGAALMVIVLL